MTKNKSNEEALFYDLLLMLTLLSQDQYCLANMRKSKDVCNSKTFIISNIFLLTFSFWSFLK